MLRVLCIIWSTTQCVMQSYTAILDNFVLRDHFHINARKFITQLSSLLIDALVYNIIEFISYGCSSRLVTYVHTNPTYTCFFCMYL